MQRKTDGALGVGGLVPLLFPLLVACSSSGPSTSPSDVAEPAPTSPSAEVKAFSYLTNSIPAQVTVDGATGWAVIDTGNPWLLLDPKVFPSVASVSASSGGTIPEVLAAGATVVDAFGFGTSSGDVPIDSTFSIDGNVGCSIVCNFITSLNYRDVTFALGDVPLPTGLGAATTIDFDLAGQDSEDGIAQMPSRVVVEVAIEGARYSMIVDTGATNVTVSKAVYDALTRDGRVQVSGGDAVTTSGSSSTELTRAASVSVGGVSVDGVVISYDSAFDANLSAVSTDAGKTIDGSLGGGFLHDFYVTIDYPKKQLRLARYEDLGFILDAGEHVNFTLGVDGSTYLIETVTGDAAAKGVAVGDVVVAIDGTNLASVSALEVAALLYGKVGTTRLVTFGAAETLTDQSVPILIEETLPLP